MNNFLTKNGGWLATGFYMFAAAIILFVPEVALADFDISQFAPSEETRRGVALATHEWWLLFVGVIVIAAAVVGLMSYIGFLVPPGLTGKAFVVCLVALFLEGAIYFTAERAGTGIATF